MTDPDHDYRNAIVVAIANAITLASTDPATKTVTYRRAAAAQACASMAAMLLQAPSEAALPATPDQAQAWFAEILKQVRPGPAIDSGIPGFTSRTVA